MLVRAVQEVLPGTGTENGPVSEAQTKASAVQCEVTFPESTGERAEESEGEVSTKRGACASKGSPRAA